jgi:hypothetical protein
LGQQVAVEHFQGRKRIEHTGEVLKMGNRFLMAQYRASEAFLDQIFM